MKTYIGKVVCAIFVGLAIPAYADSTTVTINAIDANGVGKQIGTIRSQSPGETGLIDGAVCDGLKCSQSGSLAPHGGLLVGCEV
jgi:hypothetical protein